MPRFEVRKLDDGRVAIVTDKTLALWALSSLWLVADNNIKRFKDEDRWVWEIIADDLTKARKDMRG